MNLKPNLKQVLLGHKFNFKSKNQEDKKIISFKNKSKLSNSNTSKNEKREKFLKKKTLDSNV